MKGHILNLDFPSGYRLWDKTPPRELITVTPCKKISESGIAEALKTLVVKNPQVIVATDFDREGELIGVEAIELSRRYCTDISRIKRARFSAITSSEIQNAFSDLLEQSYQTFQLK